jgi:hypothetical protein
MQQLKIVVALQTHYLMEPIVVRVFSLGRCPSLYVYAPRPGPQVPVIAEQETQESEICKSLTFDIRESALTEAAEQERGRMLNAQSGWEASITS